MLDMTYDWHCAPSRAAPECVPHRDVVALGRVKFEQTFLGLAASQTLSTKFESFVSTLGKRDLQAFVQACRCTRLCLVLASWCSPGTHLQRRPHLC